MARITKYLLVALIVAVAFNQAAKAQEEEPAVEPEAEAEVVEAPAEEALVGAPVEGAPVEAEAEPAPPPAEEVAPEAEEAAEPEAGSTVEEDSVQVGSIKKVGSWLSKYGWWNIWKGIGLKKAGDWWKWDKIFKEDWWKKKWFLLGASREAEESKMMLVLSDPQTRSMGVNAEEDATYFLAPPGFENELAKRGIAVNPSIVPVRKTQKKQYQQQQQQRPKPRPQQLPQQYQRQYPYQLQNSQYVQPWLQRAFPGLDMYDREGGQGSEIDSIRMRPNAQSLSRTMVASLKQQIPDIIPLGSSDPNTRMYAYDSSGVMQLLPQETPSLPSHQQYRMMNVETQNPAVLQSHQQYQMMNEDTQNPAVLQEYQQARTGFQKMAKTKKSEIPQRTGASLKITEPEALPVPMPFPRSNSITTKEEIERALNDEQTQKMLEQYARKNWKTIRKDAIILKFVPKTDMEARPSVKRQATMKQEQMPMPRNMMPEQINSAYAKDFHDWAVQQGRAMQMSDQQQLFRQPTPTKMQNLMEQQPREEMPQPMMQHGPMTPQEPRQMQQMPMMQQEPRQSIHDSQTPSMQQQPAMQQQIPTNNNQQQAMIQQEPRQWLQEQPTMPPSMPRQWVEEQPQQQKIMSQQETMPQNEPRQWVQEQQWMSIDPSILDELKPRQMTHQTAQPQQPAEGSTMTDGGKLENKDDQQPIVSEMGPQTEDNARFFKKVIRPSHPVYYETHNYNVHTTDSHHGYGGGYGGSPSYGGGSSYGRNSGYGAGSSSGYEPSHHGGGYGDHSQGSGYGGHSGSGYGSSGSYGDDHSGTYGGGYHAGHGGYGNGGSSGYESSPGGSYGSHGAGYSGNSGSGYGSSGKGDSYGGGHGGNYGGSHGGNYGGGHGGNYGAGHGGGYGAGHGSGYGGGHGGGYRTAEMGGSPMATIF